MYSTWPCEVLIPCHAIVCLYAEALLSESTWESRCLRFCMWSTPHGDICFPNPFAFVLSDDLRSVFLRSVDFYIEICCWLSLEFQKLFTMALHCQGEEPDLVLFSSHSRCRHVAVLQSFNSEPAACKPKVQEKLTKNMRETVSSVDPWIWEVGPDCCEERGGKFLSNDVSWYYSIFMYEVFILHYSSFSYRLLLTGTVFAPLLTLTCNIRWDKLFPLSPVGWSKCPLNLTSDCISN